MRAFVYQHFAERTRAPSVDDTAGHFNINNEEAGGIYTELNNRHAFFLEPGTLTIRMANPFSNIPTDFKVHANSSTYFANCAWDMLGIPAALGCDAKIDAVCTESNEKVNLEIKDGQIHINSVTLSDSEGSLPFKSETLLVHFPIPFARWYDDLVFT